MRTRALNIIGLVLSVTLVPFAYYYVQKVHEARLRSYLYDLLDNGVSFDFTARNPGDLTLEANIYIIGFSSFFIFQCVTNLQFIKTITSKSLSVIMIALLGAGFLYNLLMLSRPNHISFDEGGQVWMIAGVLMAAYSIISIIQQNRVGLGKRKIVENDILDDDIV